MTLSLFPLNGRRGFGADIVNDAVDTLDFINNTVGNLSHNLLLLSGLVASRVSPISSRLRTFYLELIRPLGSFVIAATQTGKSFGTH